MNLMLKDMLKLPNLLSLYRLILAIVFPILWTKNLPVYVFLLLLLTGGLSDALDGFLARTFHWETKLGKILDPIADKTFINVMFFLLYYDRLLPFDFFVIVLIRDLGILLGAVYLYLRSSKRIEFQPTYLGKVSTALQIGFIFTYLFHLLVLRLNPTFIFVFGQLVIFFTLASGFHYTLLFIKIYKTSPNK
ncbi:MULTISPECIES: CDP-alcohol phosphatidyltransferase family protein [Thermodesulfobacterium]|jgi:cardiolipin synthase|uniref:CDP-diacylglycerol--glycerol-3-phosphate 3-phosphatidyltransferase n=1 Tax=Thermodesulfobacterium commune TaxID=1741 RepID=A0A101FJ25_9BACT|nr:MULTISPECIES: CDP-alcohol phosphatidyltransferase family protein [Thermodesulfobacterium]KUJ97560.1 MAG: CDP-alcohol phosphatidyltransferase [Thermodesulfobacterium sp. 37_54]KUK19826.1 MAG: CDP-alcohol phosphatidyltransferase [Thermodesulfobacterium commune]KUK37955.1 MAG: CDP-alcohol phosphatidyltransferase [Thermodesulfobacterium commune]MDK2861329.1 hypothetical protein [Thermodesulfobacterium sp.]HAA83187.1 CDP-alcohol phosphatidyltransferase family protein [Thermodesulfobacterium comm